MASRRLLVHNIADRLVPYRVGHHWQHAARAAVRGERSAEAAAPAAAGDRLLLLEHSPTYTLGRRSTLENLRFPTGAPPGGSELVRVERGGEVTYHGPAQLVGYPIFDLTAAPHRKDLHWFLRTLEGALIDALGAYGLEGARDEAGTGVWVGDAKIAAVGLSASSWVTMHGFALNVAPDLAAFDAIVPCGIEGRGVTSLAEQGVGAAMPDVRETVAAAIAKAFALDATATALPPDVDDAQAPPGLLPVER